MSDVQKFGEEFQRVGKDNSFAVRGGTALPTEKDVILFEGMGHREFLRGL